MRKLLLSVAAAGVLFAGQAQSAVLTFDDTSSLAFGYGGFTWTQMGVLDPSSLAIFANSGYNAGKISGDRIAYGSSGSDPAKISALSTFKLNSAYITAAWNDNLELKVAGLRGSSVVFSRTLILNATNPVREFFEWTGIDSVTFVSTGGTLHPGYSGGGNQFVIDNLVVNDAVPEATTWAMFIGGFGLIGATIRRRPKATIA
jgi:hypothetical protein